MPDAGPTAVLPLRPLTVGELLDSAVLLFRGHVRVLVPVALVLAVGEQFVLHPLRLAAATEPPAHLPHLHQLPPYWLLLAVGAATEGVAIALLGNLTGRAATGVVLGRAAPAGRLLRPGGARFGATLAAAVIAGAVMFVAALAGPAWLLGFALLGPLVPTIVVDRLGPLPALRRAAALAARSAARSGGIRLLGYLVWWILRLGLALGVVNGLDELDLLPSGWLLPMSAAAWVAVNSVAYPALACLDAVLHLETRIRTEGLDIALAQARRTGRHLGELPHPIPWPPDPAAPTPAPSHPAALDPAALDPAALDPAVRR
ncbi:hypothetical protein [Plantactinospora sp. CA-290183]|uniref:hypothetical protein n=1 Tax=Plantactinospora sp. CA-290183 TaxID=3240006 RepID=UPI003D941DED